MAGIGPVPLAAMLLADMGAEVIRIDRMASPAVLSGGADDSLNIVNRGRRSVQVDLKQERGRDLVLQMVRDCDVFVEGFRPGVTERLGLGPADCMAVNPALVYGRMTGWGQDGPLAQRAGHDINYIALSGALWATGRPSERPVPPLNLLGDYGGGAMFLAFGVVCALLERTTTGQGQVVDAAMIDGVSVLAAMFSALRAMGRWKDERGANMLDTGFPDYEVYECSDGKFVALGALEPQFYAALATRTGIGQLPGDRNDPATFAERKQRWAALFKTRTRDEWAGLTADSDACLTPVLDWDEAADHPHLRARATYVDAGGVRQPAPAPRFSRTKPPVPRGASPAGSDTQTVLRSAGYSESQIQSLRERGALT
jgi:alpha-methylacyl-CoA racemase